jgi:hypothetical protein
LLRSEQQARPNAINGENGDGNENENEMKTTLPLLLCSEQQANAVNENPNGLVKTSAVNPVGETRSRKEGRTTGKR